MTRLKVGGLALIIGGTTPENIGRLVTTVRHIGLFKSTVTGATHDCWKVLAPVNKPLLGQLSDGRLALSYGGPMPTDWLMPIGETDPDQTTAATKERGAKS